jgi:hypothetical protein
MEFGGEGLDHAGSVGRLRLLLISCQRAARDGLLNPQQPLERVLVSHLKADYLGSYPLLKRRRHTIDFGRNTVDFGRQVLQICGSSG